MDASEGKKQLQKEVLSLLVGAFATYVSVKVMIHMLDPQRKQKDEAKEQRNKLMQRLKEVEPLELDQYECLLCADVLNPADISVEWADIGGLREVKKAIKELIVTPLQHPYLFSGSKLLHPPKGILLYGPPGTGKTMLAKAIAKQSGARFLNLSQASLQNKWFGESVKLVRAVFTLAAKLQPAIIFVDEIDSFLRERDEGEHQAHSDMKTEFMTLWDGVGTDDDAAVVVLGASNRPWAIDQAIQRRLSRAFAIGLPAPAQRKQILKKILKDERLSPPVERFDFDELARRTEGYSGSDLSELCSSVAYAPVRDHLAALTRWRRSKRRLRTSTTTSSSTTSSTSDAAAGPEPESDSDSDSGSDTEGEGEAAQEPPRRLRPLTLEDFTEVVDGMPTTQQQSRSYHSDTSSSSGTGPPPRGAAPSMMPGVPGGRTAGEAGGLAGQGARDGTLDPETGRPASLFTNNFIFHMHMASPP